MQKVVVIGAAVVDVLLKSKDLKTIKGHELPGGLAICEMVGGKLEAEESMVASGGGGTNVAVGLHRLGEAVKVISRIGSDGLGEVMTKQLVGEGLDLSMMQRGEGKTGLSVVLVSVDGGRSIVTYRGESGLIDPSKINWDEIKKADWIQVSSLGGEMQFLEDLIMFAFNNGVKIGLNPGRKELEQKDMLLKIVSKLDFFNVNRMEASVLTGVDYDNEKEIMKKVADMGCRVVAVTDGKRGASVIVNRNWLKMDAFQVKSVDDTGAGDAFVCGIVAGILQNKKPEDFLKMGLASGGSQVMKLGAKDGMLYKNEVAKWVSKKLKMTEEVI